MGNTYSAKLRGDKGGKKLLKIFQSLDLEKVKEMAYLISGLERNTINEEDMYYLLEKYKNLPTGDLTVYHNGAWISQMATGGTELRDLKEAIRIAVLAQVMWLNRGHQNLIIDCH